MTEIQKRTRDFIERSYRPSPRTTELSFARLLAIIPPLWRLSSLPQLTLWTDENQAYPRSIGYVPILAATRSNGRFIHKVYPSTAPRNAFNPLFAVNYYDRELRKDLAAYRRESTCYGRNVANGLMRLIAHLVYHNYQKPYRVGASRKTGFVHAQVAGIDAGKISEGLSWIYTARQFLSKQKLSTENERIWLKQAVTPLKRGPSYVPKYALAK